MYYGNTRNIGLQPSWDKGLLFNYVRISVNVNEMRTILQSVTMVRATDSFMGSIAKGTFQRVSFYIFA